MVHANGRRVEGRLGPTKNPNLAGVPLIAITGSHPSVEQAGAQMAGFAKFLLKPAKLPDIVIAVASVVSTQDGSTQPPPPGAPTTKVVRSTLATLNHATPCREHGSVLGTICCYDDVPRALDEGTRDAVAAAATELEPLFREIFTST